MTPHYRMYQQVDRRDVLRHAEAIMYDGPFRLHDSLLVVQLEDHLWCCFAGSRDVLSVTMIADSYSLVVHLVAACKEGATHEL